MLLPSVINRDPAPSEVEVSRIAAVAFTITGDEDVDLSSLNVDLQQDGGGYEPAVVGGVPNAVSGPTTAINAVTDGYDVVIEKVIAHKAATVTDVRVNADNMNGFPMAEVNYSFTTTLDLPGSPVLTQIGKGSN